MILSLLLLSLAAICKALADTLDHHFDTSIFRGKPRRWWDPNVLHRRVPMIFGYPLDAWHIINSVQILSWLLLAVTWQSYNTWWIDVLAAGGIFVIVFNLFYNKIFR